MNKRQQKKIAKQNILNDIKKKHNINDKQARSVYKNSEYTKLTSRQLSAKSNLLVKNNNAKNSIFDKTIKTGKDAIPYLNSIISTFKQEVNGFKSTVAKWIENHSLDVTTLPTKWVRRPLNELDIKLMEYKEYSGLLHDSDDLFVRNFMNAQANAGLDIISPIDEFNKIIKDVMSTQENNVKDAYELITSRFEKIKNDVFYASEQVQIQIAINSNNIYVGKTNPAFDKSMFDK